MSHFMNITPALYRTIIYCAGSPAGTAACEEINSG